MGLPCTRRSFRNGVLHMVIDVNTALKICVLVVGVGLLCFSKCFSEKIYDAWETKFGIKAPKAFSRIMFTVVGVFLIILSTLGLLGIIGD